MNELRTLLQSALVDAYTRGHSDGAAGPRAEMQLPEMSDIAGKLATTVDARHAAAVATLKAQVQTSAEQIRALQRELKREEVVRPLASTLFGAKPDPEIAAPKTVRAIRGWAHVDAEGNWTPAFDMGGEWADAPASAAPARLAEIGPKALAEIEARRGARRLADREEARQHDDLRWRESSGADRGR